MSSQWHAQVFSILLGSKALGLLEYISALAALDTHSVQAHLKMKILITAFLVPAVWHSL